MFFLLLAAFDHLLLPPIGKAFHLRHALRKERIEIEKEAAINCRSRATSIRSIRPVGDAVFQIKLEQC